MEIDSTFSVPPGTGSSNASNVKAIATTASVKEDQPLDRREVHLALGLCYVVLDLSRA